MKDLFWGQMATRGVLLVARGYSAMQDDTRRSCHQKMPGGLAGLPVPKKTPHKLQEPDLGTPRTRKRKAVLPAVPTASPLMKLNICKLASEKSLKNSALYLQSLQ